ncbi:MAG: GNAT family N-acetyltransferase [Cytophagales bacterium]|nr:GNAT family N-acetyltransferase [Cytophagales bacterium]
MFAVKETVWGDVPGILALYQTVATESGGIIRLREEITLDYVNDFITKSLRTGLSRVVHHPRNQAEIVAEMHAYQYGPAAFSHILTDLTIVVHPSFQGQKIGMLIFEHFLAEVAGKMPHILRVELFVRENNMAATRFYKKLGFVEEGRHWNKIKNKDGSLETPLEMTWFNPRYEG